MNIRNEKHENREKMQLFLFIIPYCDKCGDFEYCITNTIMQLLALLGIEDNPTYKWNRVANQSEETQMVLTAASYLDDEAVLNHLPWLTPEEVNEILKRKDAEDLNRLAFGMKETPEGVSADDET